LSGGPGQWAIDAVLPRFTGDFAAPIQSKRAIIVFDQRGSGRSQPALNCPEVMSYRDFLGSLTTTEEDVEIDRRIFIACHERLVREGNDLSGYSSAATAQDIDDLMAALGYDRFNLYGLSYGTRVALTALRDQRGARIRSAVLDSVVPLQADLVSTGSAVERSFDRLLADCAADPACNRTYPNLRQMTFDLVDRFNREPLMITPIDPETNQPFPVIISGDRLVRMAESAFQNLSLIPFLPVFVTSTAGGDTALLTAALAVIGAPALYSPGVQNAVLCNEETPLIDRARVEQERALVNPAIAHAFAATIPLRRPPSVAWRPKPCRTASTSSSAASVTSCSSSRPRRPGRPPARCSSWPPSSTIRCTPPTVAVWRRSLRRSSSGAEATGTCEARGGRPWRGGPRRGRRRGGGPGPCP
jgi:pimeloyl-ACP methyl ester carboxylesterase